MITLSRAGVAAVRRAVDIVSGLVTEDTDDDTARGLHSLARELTHTAEGNRGPHLARREDTPC